MVQNILPTRERLARLRKVESPCFIYCGQLDSIAHLISCPHNTEVTRPLVNCIASYVDNSTAENITILNLKLEESQELPIAWLVATCLGQVWEERAAGKQVKLMNTKAVLEAKVALLKETYLKYNYLHNSAFLLEEMINLHFN